MNKKLILELSIVFIIIAGGITYFLGQAPMNPPVNTITNTQNCADCGKGGWQKMDVRCGQTIVSPTDFKSCLMKFSWSSVDQSTDVDEISSGYIEINGTEILKNPTINSVEVFIYHQWAVDKDGNLYLLAQLG